MLKKILALVKSARHCVLATTGPEGPHASLMAYAAPEDALAFWMATLTDTRKFRNLAADPRASLLIDGREQGVALTVAARLAPFISAEAERDARRELAARHPGLAEALAGQPTRMLRFLPLRFQFLASPEGPVEEILLEVEKNLDGSGRRV